MENPVDHTVDLGLVNYVQHPENKNYVVFRFVDSERAATFEEKLTENKIWFEKGEEEKRGRIYLLFGVHGTDFKKVERINYEVEGMYKKPTIPFKGLRFFLYIFSLIVLVLSLLGYCHAQKRIEESKVMVVQ